MNLYSVRRPFAIALLALTVLPGASLAQAQNTKKMIQAQYDKMNAAVKRRDIKAAGSFMTPDFTNKGANGQVTNRDQTLQNLQIGLARLGNVRTMKATIQKLTEKGGKATADVQMRLETEVAEPANGPNPGKKHAMASQHYLGMSGSKRETYGSCSTRKIAPVLKSPWTASLSTYLYKHPVNLSASGSGSLPGPNAGHSRP